MRLEITGRLSGGLGNQMFQYAAARSLSLKENAHLQIDIRDSIYSGDREFGLSHFNLSSGVEILKEGKPLSKLQKLVKRINGSLYDEPKFEYSPSFELLKAPKYLRGYYQSEKYFCKYSETIREDFKLIPSEDEKIMNLSAALIPKHKTISLHIRRGDYLSAKQINIQGVLNLDYYFNALEIIKGTLDEKPEVCIFTDDINWTEENLKLPFPSRIISRHTKRPIEDLILMSHCTHHIIANSTFSWWGAWLNSSKSKIVITPKKRFADKMASKLDIKDLYPDSWIRI